MNRKPPAFQFYPTDWKSSIAIRLMSPEQRGYFIQLLAEAWDSDRPGYLPKDVPLWWLAGAKDEVTFKGSSRLVEDQFKAEVGTGRLYNQRLVDERAAQIEWREKCSKGGKNSGRSRQRKLEVKGSSSKNELPIENTTNKNQTLQSSPSLLPVTVPAYLPKRKNKEQNLSASNGDVDPRHHPVRESIKALQKALSDQEIWDGSAAKALDRVLKERPKYTIEMLIQCVVYWFASEGQIPTAPPRQWLPSITTYTGMPLDRFGKPSRKIDTGPFWRILKGETKPEEAIDAQWEAFCRTSLGDPSGLQYAREHNAPTWVIEKLEASLIQPATA